MELLGNSIVNGKKLSITIHNSDWYLLWKYCCTHVPFLITAQQFKDGLYNKNGITLSQSATHTLAGVLQSLLLSKQVEKDEEAQHYKDMYLDGEKCEVCDGTGKIEEERCENCVGKGVYEDANVYRNFSTEAVLSFTNFLFNIDQLHISSKKEALEVEGLFLERDFERVSSQPNN